ncbi:FAD-dependent monooxygenase [Gordonia zhaorongruii]|uniref:FAD-dependent monooxygenase n=1 Tax=Gordonia zhaorongruii TaxID=2597659 RepID=UPI001042CE80|nr:FAD-dependent monooxygenase [Gordonia zhaorongruii]
MTTLQAVGKVRISGAGVAGLAAAVILSRAGIRVTVDERADAPPTTGTVFGLAGAAQDALDRCGVLDRIRKVSVEQRAGALRGADGRVFVTANLPEPVLLVTRPDLQDVLADELAAGVVNYGRPGISASDLAGDAVLIGADGTSGPTRTQLFGSATAPRHVGTTVWRGTVETFSSPSVEDGSLFGETWGRGALFGITPRWDGRLNFFGASRAAPGTTTVEDFFTRFADWHRDVRMVMGGVDRDDMLHHDLFQSPPLARFTSGRAALVGDAAHTMTPHLGRGAGEALVDAVTLAELLVDFPADGALARYDRMRRRHGLRMVRASAAVGALALAEHGTPIRDGMLGLVGGAMRWIGRSTLG